MHFIILKNTLENRMLYVIKSPVSIAPLQFSSLEIRLPPFYPRVASFHLAFGVCP